MQDVRAILSSTGIVQDSEIVDIQRLAGDASSKEFYRIFLKDKELRSLILLKLVAANGPLHSGKTQTQDRSFIEIGEYLRKHGLPVPKLYWNDTNLGYGLEEDLGDNLLANYLNPNFIDDVKLNYFQRAIQLIPRIQKVPDDQQVIIYRRFISAENYQQESKRFIEYYLANTQLLPAELKCIEIFIEELCQNVCQHPQVPIYRDLMAWNVMIDPEDQVRLVDFQDLIIGSYGYDLASLLHDRDTDLALGDQNLNTLFKFYCSENQHSTDFTRHYLECLLQRNLRLAGQFLNLTSRTGRACYESWVPGCMNRIGRALATKVGWPDSYQAVVDILIKVSADFRSGYSKPYDC